MLLLETARLHLRDLRSDDFEAFYASANDPEYRRFYAEEQTTRSFYEGLFQRLLSSATASPRMKYQLAICLKSGELIGTCGVRIEEPEHQQASFGCGVARTYWGKAYACEASQRLLDYAFASLPVHRIYAETISENTRARKLAERLGLRLEGEYKHHRLFQGRWWNTVIYAKLAAQSSVTAGLRLEA